MIARQRCKSATRFWSIQAPENGVQGGAAAARREGKLEPAVVD